eukprot:2320444-Rhodomonas_salina.1
MADRTYAFAVTICDFPVRVVAHVLTLFFQRVNLPGPSAAPLAPQQPAAKPWRDGSTWTS